MENKIQVLLDGFLKGEIKERGAQDNFWNALEVAELCKDYISESVYVEGKSINLISKKLSECLQCKNNYPKTKTWQKYCSKSCKVMANRINGFQTVQLNIGGVDWSYKGNLSRTFNLLHTIFLLEEEQGVNGELERAIAGALYPKRDLTLVDTRFLLMLLYATLKRNK